MKKFFISIPKPCHESWDAMTPEGKGKFCGSCQKTVVDFSEMNDRQLAEFFKKPASSLCGRFMPDQLERAIILPQKRIPWVWYFFTIAIPTFLISCKFVGRQALQGKVEKTEQRITGDTVMSKSITLPPPPVAGGFVQMPIEPSVEPGNNHQEIKILDTAKWKVKAIVKDSNGFSAVPFEYHPVKIEKANRSSSASANVLQGIMGSIAISGIRVSKEQPSVPVLKQEKSPAVSSLFIFPNPVASGSLITLHTKLFEQGSYTVTVINAGGSVMQNSKIDLSKEQSAIRLNTLAAGVYFVVLAETETGKRFTETLIVH